MEDADQICLILPSFRYTRGYFIFDLAFKVSLWSLPSHNIMTYIVYM